MVQDVPRLCLAGRYARTGQQALQRYKVGAGQDRLQDVQDVQDIGLCGVASSGLTAADWA